jgi:hypothetical protein
MNRLTRIFIVLAVILSSAIAGGWWIAKTLLEARLTERLLAEADAGRNWQCEGRKIIGFPFELKMTCDSLKLKIVSDKNPIEAQAGRLLLSYRLAAPSQVNLSLEGPLNGQNLKTAHSLAAQWTRLNIALHLAGVRPQTVAIQADDARIAVIHPTDGRSDIQAGPINVQLAATPHLRAPDAKIDLSVLVQQITSADFDKFVLEDGPADIALQAQLSDFDLQNQNRLKRAAVLQSWSDKGGRIVVSRLSVLKERFRVAAKGELGLDGNGFPAGRFTIGAAGIEGLMRRFGVPQGAFAIEGLLSRYAERKARRDPSTEANDPPPFPLPLVLRNGLLYVGPVRTPVRLPQFF